MEVFVIEIFSFVLIESKFKFFEWIMKMKTTMTINKDLPIAFRTKTMTKTNIDLRILESHLRIDQKPWAWLGEL